MSISIIDHVKLVEEALERFAERRLRFAVSRFDWRIFRVEKALSVESGSELIPARGDTSKACRVTVVFFRTSKVEVIDRDADPSRCISRVVDRAGREVARAIDLASRPDSPRAIL